MRSLVAVLGALVIVGCDGDPCQTVLALDRDRGRISAHVMIDHAEPGPEWRLVIVHEGHVAWRGHGRPGPFWLDDYDGADHVSIRATGPNGRICTAEKTLSTHN
jgi:hypothetical protein